MSTHAMLEKAKQLLDRVCVTTNSAGKNSNESQSIAW